MSVLQATYSIGLISILLLTDFTPLVLRAMPSAAVLSATFLTAPVSVTAPFKVSTCKPMIENTLLPKSFALISDVRTVSSIYSPVVSFPLVTAHPWMLPIVTRLIVLTAATDTMDLSNCFFMQVFLNFSYRSATFMRWAT
jgi:hypothetical protein